MLIYVYSSFHCIVSDVLLQSQITSAGFLLRLILEISNICMVCSSQLVFFGSRIKTFTFDEIKLEFIDFHENETIQKNYWSHRSLTLLFIKEIFLFKPIQQLTTKTPGTVLVEKRGWTLFREDAEKAAFIPVENCITIIIMCLPANQNTSHKK